MKEQKKLALRKEAIKTKEQKGITLIALIVTIIIMLILAGVTINIALGDNGLFSKSRQAVEIHREEAAREKVNMAIGEYLFDINTREMTEEEKDNHLKEILSNVGKTSVASDDKYYEIDVDGHIFWVNKETQEIISKGKTDGTEVEPEPEPEQEIESIALSQTTLTIGVGKTTEVGLQVTYTPSNAKNQGVTWSTSDETKVAVNSNGKVTGVSETEENETVTITATTANGKTATCSVTVYEGGVEKHININGTSTVVNTKAIYGSTVTGYTCARTDVSWQLFYIDEVNKDNSTDISKVYLIASDFVVPPVQNKTPKLIAGGNERYPKGYRFGTSTTDTSILGSFTGTVPNTTFTTNYLAEWKGTSAASQANLQATNYMLDQTMWSEYKGNKATESYGGPTLPLFAASYNDICKESTRLGYTKSEYGYLINIGGGEYRIAQSGYGNPRTQNGIYFYGNNSDSATGMWLASPNEGYEGGTLMYAGYDGITHPGFMQYNVGFRPVVSLQSNVQFIANGNGTYTIKP